MKKIPLRSCIVTKEKLDKRELLRVVKSKDGIISVDLTGKSNGRGAYLKKDIEVVEKARKSKVLDRVFECPVPNELYDEIIEKIS